MNALIAFVVFLGLVRHSRQAENATDYFVSPPPAGSNALFVDDVVILLDSSYAVEWVTTMSSYQVYLFQQSLTVSAGATGPTVYSKSQDQTEQGGFTWTVSTGSLDLDSSNVFFLLLTPDGTISNGITSHYFNITTNAADVSSSTTTSSPATSATSSPSSSTSNTAATTSSTSSASTSSSLSSTTPVPSAASSPSSSSSSSSSSSKIGLGVGLGVGIPIVIILAGILVLKVRQYKKDRSGSAYHASKYDPVEGQTTSTDYSGGYSARVEMPLTTVAQSKFPHQGKWTPTELPGSDR